MSKLKNNNSDMYPISYVTGDGQTIRLPINNEFIKKPYIEFKSEELLKPINVYSNLIGIICCLFFYCLIIFIIYKCIYS